MIEDVYLIDTCSIIDLFHHHPVDIYPELWGKLNTHFNELQKDGRLIILDFVRDEIIRDTIGKNEKIDDPIIKWINTKTITEISDNISIIVQAQKIIEKFPQSADIYKTPPAADPYLIGYALYQINQRTLFSEKRNIVIVTEEKRNPGKYNFGKLRKRSGAIPEITKVKSICDYYNITSIDYQEMFRAEGWRF